jgi:hypothetical protein
MNEIARFPTLERTDRGFDRKADPVPRPARHKMGRRRGGWLLAAIASLLLAGGLGYGGWRDYAQRQAVAATAQQKRDFVPDVLVAQVVASGATHEVSLPGTTFAYEAANVTAQVSDSNSDLALVARVIRTEGTVFSA